MVTGEYGYCPHGGTEERAVIMFGAVRLECEIPALGQQEVVASGRGREWS